MRERERDKSEGTWTHLFWHRSFLDQRARQTACALFYARPRNIQKVRHSWQRVRTSVNEIKADLLYRSSRVFLSLVVLL